MSKNIVNQIIKNFKGACISKLELIPATPQEVKAGTISLRGNTDPQTYKYWGDATTLLRDGKNKTAKLGYSLEKVIQNPKSTHIILVFEKN